jgi:hypothetical protein
MGDRRNVIVTKGNGGPNVSLYTHWYGSQLPQIVARALDRGRSRWDDPTYLTRIIFSQMLLDGDAVEELTGFGIEAVPGLTALTEASPSRDLVVNIAEQQVTVSDMTFSFTEFAKKF